MKTVNRISHRIGLTMFCLLIWTFQVLYGQYVLFKAFITLLRYPKSFYKSFKYEINVIVETLHLEDYETR